MLLPHCVSQALRPQTPCLLIRGWGKMSHLEQKGQQVLEQLPQLGLGPHKRWLELLKMRGLLPKHSLQHALPLLVPVKLTCCHRLQAILQPADELGHVKPCTDVQSHRQGFMRTMHAVTGWARRTTCTCCTDNAAAAPAASFAAL